jgi:nucleoside-diphosphate-sugar epimerase/intein/homing endonuclease
MARVVVTGGAGFLGSHLSEALLDRGDEVVAIDNLITGSVDNIEHLFTRRDFTFVEHDVSQYVHVPGDVDAVLHFASPASPKDYLEKPIQTLKVGSLGTHNTLGLAKAKRATFMLASTSEVYGDPDIHPQPESYWGHVNPIGPRGVYDEAKRFAEAMTMAYHRYHGLDVRIVRIFNSILADEQVLFFDGKELRRERVGELAARVGDNVDLMNFEVPAFDNDGAVRSVPAAALVGHRPTGPCFRVETRYGRSVRVTGDHSLFVEGADGRPMAKPVSQLTTADRIAIARRIDVPERDRRSVPMAEVWDASGGDAWDLMIRAEGLGALAWARRDELFGALAADRKPSTKTWRNGIWTQIIRMRDADEMPLAAFRRLGVPLPADGVVRLRTAGGSARLPLNVPINDDTLWLLGLFVAEGCIYESGKNAFIAISCEDDLLDLAEKVVERDLGLHIVRAGGSDARAASIFIHSKLLLRLVDHLGLGSAVKRIPGWILGLPLERLGWFLEGYRAGDGVHSGKRYEEGIRHEFSTVSEDLKDDLVVAFARFGLVPSVGRYLSRIKARDRTYPFWRLTLCNVSPWSPLEWHRGVEQRLNARCTGDLLWATVTSIEEIEPTDTVYDFCVPGLENFWAGSGVMAHNTFGPRMRVQDGRVVSNFLTQAIEGKPITIYGDGTQTRSFCFVSDEVRGFLALLDSNEIGPINIGNDDEFTVSQLAELVLEVTGSKSEIRYESLPVDDPKQRRPDLTLARQRLGWSPNVALRQGLERTAEHFRHVLTD